jgi:hypothetical protein
MLRRVVLLVTLGLTLAAMAPSSVSAYFEAPVYRYRTLSPSQYTSGVEKSFVVTWSISACAGVAADIEIRFYYDVLNASRINITKAKVKYYLGPSTRVIYGGPMQAYGANGLQTIGTEWGDYNTFYHYSSGTIIDDDGYRYVGSYTHNGPVNVNGNHDNYGAYATISKDWVTAYNTSCSTNFQGLGLSLRW